MNGRMVDVIIEDEKHTDERTGVEVIAKDVFGVWADADKKPFMEKIEGVCWVFQEPFSKTHYRVYFDPRYDREYIKREIEAAILCS